MANTQFLDEHGLETLVRQIKNTFTRLDGKNTVTGQQTFNEGIKIAETKGVVAAKNGASNIVWATDGSKFDLSDYAALVADKYPFGISSFSSNKPSVIEVSTTPISPVLTWNYKNEKHTVTEQKVAYGSTTKTVPVGTKTLSWDPIDISSHKTISFTLTAKADEGAKSDTKSVSINVVHKRYYGVLNSTDVPTSFTGLTACSTLKTTASENITVTLNNQHACYMYPSYMTDINTIKDQNNFSMNDSFVKKTTTINGVGYTCWIQKDAASASNFTLKFS